MSQANPLPRSLRRRDYPASAGQTVFGPADFIAFDPADVRVRVKTVGGLGFATVTSGVTVTLSNGNVGVPTATFAVGRADTDIVRVESRRVNDRTSDVTRAGAILTALLERDLDKMAVALLDLRRDLDETVAPPDDLIDAVGQAQAARGGAVAAQTAAEAAALAAAASAALLGSALLYTPQVLTAGQKQQAISNLGLSSVVGADRRSQLLAHMRVSRLLGARQLIFTGVADGFGATDGINAGASTGYTYDAVNKRVTPSVSAGADQIPTMTGATTSGVTISASDSNAGAGFQPWHIGDKNAGTSWVTNNGTTSATLVIDFGAGNAKTITNYSMLPRGGAVLQAPYTWKLQGSNDGSTYTDLDTRTAYSSWVDGSYSSFDVATPGSYRYYRLNVSAPQPGAGGPAIGVAELKLNSAGVVNAMSLVTATLTVDTAPPLIRVGILADLTETITGSDLTGEATRTGAAWALGALSATKIGSNLWFYETAPIDVSGQASGVAVAARFKTPGSKSLRIVGYTAEVVV